MPNLDLNGISIAYEDTGSGPVLLFIHGVFVNGKLWRKVMPALLQPAITGKISDETWRQQTADQLQTTYPDADAAQAVALWSESSGVVDSESLALVCACRDHCPVYLITNATSRLPSDLAWLRILDVFDDIINSSDIGVAKPDPRIFEIALQTAGITAQDALFIDDSATNVQAALALGITSHHYQDVARLRHFLAQHNIL